MFKTQLKITKHAKNQGNVNHKPRKTGPTARDQKNHKTKHLYKYA